MSRHRHSPSSGLVLGIGAILLGLVLLLDQLPGVRQAHLVGWMKHLWPLILVALGAVRIRENRQPAFGWIQVAAGLLLLMVTLGQGSLAGLIWPGILLCAGIFIILHSLRERRTGLEPDPAGGPDTDAFVAGTAVLTGFKRRPRTRAFRGGALTAIFGGFELDLREAQLEDGPARLDLFLMFGGGEIRVPPDWEVRLQATAIAGGLSDKLGPGPSDPGGRPQLVLTGLILFGGCEVRR